MLRKIMILLATIGLLITSAGLASAQNNPGSCTLVGGTVQINVKEQPKEGDVDYISIASPVRLNVGGTDPTRAAIYSSPDYTELIKERSAYSAPVDGDGFWNYRIDFDWDGFSDEHFMIQHAWVHPEQYGSSSQCTTNIYT